MTSVNGKPRFARDVPRAVQRIVEKAREIIAAPVPGERGKMRRVEGGMAALHAAVGNDSHSSTRDAVIAAEAMHLMRRSGATWTRQVYVAAEMEDVVCAVFRRNSVGIVVTCAFCGALALRGQWCTGCQPAFRRDRAWRQTAVNLLHEGISPVQIAAVVGQQLYPGPGDGPLVGVVAQLLAEVPDLVPDVFRRAYLESVGAAVENPASVLGARRRLRRHRAEG